MDWRPYIASHPSVLGGAPRVRGTRVLVSTILELLSEGSDRNHIFRCHPELSDEAITAALAFAADLMRPGTLAEETFSSPGAIERLADRVAELRESQSQLALGDLLH